MEEVLSPPGGLRLLVALDTFVPARLSGALQMRDLVRELRRQGHRPLVVVPEPGVAGGVRHEEFDGCEVLRVDAPRLKDVGRVRRALAEWWLPYALLRGLRRSGFAATRWDGVVWYSPTIFLGPLVRRVKARSGCRSYLILRDLFPDWAVDAGVLRKGLVYRLFKQVERAQYRAADIIGVQTPANAPLVRRDAPAAQIEVFNNWLAPPQAGPCGIDLSRGPLAGRTVFAYTGNMGAAQGMDVLLDLALALRDRPDIGVLLVGRGTETERLRRRIADERIDNALLIDEIEAAEIPGLLAQCHVGLIALDPRHTTHNIPGKLITYLHAALPVLASVNAGNDLEALIRDEDVGRVVAGGDLARLRAHACELADDVALRRTLGDRGPALAARAFTPEAVARQLLEGLRPR